MTLLPPEAQRVVDALSADLQSTVARWLDGDIAEVAEAALDEVRSVVAVHLASGIITTFRLDFQFKLADGRSIQLHVDQDSAFWEW